MLKFQFDHDACVQREEVSVNCVVSNNIESASPEHVLQAEV